MLALDDIVIRRARDAEARACRILLPDMFTADQSPDLFVAINPGAPPSLMGAAATGTVHGPGRPGFPVQIHVVPAYRRRGVGRVLADTVLRACHGRTPVLRALLAVPAASQAAEFAAACGFTQYDEIHTFETDTRAFHSAMLRTRDRLRARGRIPEAASIVTLRDASPDAVATMVAAHFPGPRATTLSRLMPGAPEAYDLDNSVALLVGETLAGVLIYSWRNGLPIIDVRIVDPAFRGGWANILLLEAATRNGMHAGSARFQFFADTGIADTMRLAARAGAELVRVERRFWRRVP
jgi:GNAT superfamily N-acetyltransferase